MDDDRDVLASAARVRRGKGELKASVLAALGQAPGPVSAGWVRQHVDPALAHTTVATTLTRLEAASAVVRCRLGGTVVWSAVTDGAGLAAWRMRRVLEGESDRRAVLRCFVARLSPDEERWLRTRFTREEGARPGGRPAPHHG
ncbi:BlaI/MecI/CopY family transcriptional regulator [Streptomyces sp. NBC_01456]|uniref:BlaI/MecI/CopY family transcriptional regulator n=1 Tax=unclassified Streptomyces TaxID=2593676 RepID=UPI002E361F84|nr:MULTISPECIES: BlaI/MecI/CopY family transcriptional regulator [unclassified Streptomyces]